jgi:predicted transcriptional regulator of viral defense system
VTQPVKFVWDGDNMVPETRFKRLCDKQYVIGQNYRMVEEAERSRASHDHYFAAIEDAWQNLPENLTDLYPTSEHLRKRALIAAGYADQKSIVCTSHAEAVRVQAFMKAAIDYSMVTIEGSTVTLYTPKSQSKRAMGAKEFQLSKQSVLDIVAEMVGVEPEKLAANA